MDKGYQVIENKEQVTPQTYIADVKILKFWSWMNMGFWHFPSAVRLKPPLTLKKREHLKCIAYM